MAHPLMSRNISILDSDKKVIDADSRSEPKNSEYTDIVPHSALYYILMVNSWGIGQSMTVFGIVSNILNIITFIKQGVRDAVNVSLLGLATSDLGSLVSLFFINFFVTPSVAAYDLPFVPEHMVFPIAACHVSFTRISCWITAYITFERCLCITCPLKVKVIITQRRTIAYIFCNYVIMLAITAPSYFTRPMKWIFVEDKNKSLLGLPYQENNTIEDVLCFMNNIVPMIAFIIVVICTALLVTELRKKARWRQKSTATQDKQSGLPDKDLKVVKMVVFISTIFIICYSPGAAVFILVLSDSELRFGGRHVNGMYAVFSILFHLEAINASVNILVYLGMSTKFKQAFTEIFCISPKVKQTITEMMGFDKKPKEPMLSGKNNGD